MIFTTLLNEFVYKWLINKYDDQLILMMNNTFSV